MILEILLGLIIAIILLYLYYLYLEWADNWSTKYAKYKINPKTILSSDVEYLNSYGWLLPPEPVSDGFKIINFWIRYYYSYLTM